MNANCLLQRVARGEESSVPIKNNHADVGGVPDLYAGMCDYDSMHPSEDFQRVAKGESAMKPLRNRPEDVGGDPEINLRDFDSMHHSEDFKVGTHTHTNTHTHTHTHGPSPIHTHMDHHPYTNTWTITHTHTVVFTLILPQHVLLWSMIAVMLSPP